MLYLLRLNMLPDEEMPVMAVMRYLVQQWSAPPRKKNMQDNMMCRYNVLPSKNDLILGKKLISCS